MQLVVVFSGGEGPTVKVDVSADVELAVEEEDLCFFGTSLPLT